MKKVEFIDLFSRIFGTQYSVYINSIKEKAAQFFFIARDNQKKYLGLYGDFKKIKEHNFHIKEERKVENIKNHLFQICPLESSNLVKLQRVFPYLKASTTGMKPSFGTGDRLGIVTPAHISTFEGKNIFPVLAQQSVREMERTESNWQKVMDNAIWGCFEEGYEGPFGADADHVKDLENLQKAIECGYTLFTIDPSDYINKNILQVPPDKLKTNYQELPERKSIEKHYLNKEYKIGNEKFYFDEDILAGIVLTYAKAINHVENCYKYLREHNKNDFELEVSIDETENATSPLAHLWIILELGRKGVDFQNLAPHFIGDWEKGIDYNGNLEIFKEEFKLHCQIASQMGGYKLSLHSGSDKFSVYPIFARETNGFFHVKTAGTSYLEAIKTIAICQPDLYREIHRFALECFEKDRFSYHLSTDLNEIPDIDGLKDSELVKLFDNNNSRQLIHITYGSILQERDERGEYLYRNNIYNVLHQNEEKHYQEVSKHIKHHLDLLNL